MSSIKLSAHVASLAWLTLFLLLVSTAEAAQVSVGLSHDTVQPSDTLVAEVFLDTEGESLNGFEGALLFPASLLSVREVRDGSSIVTVWLEKPSESAQGVITFSGITPGGYRGGGSRLFQVVFETKGEGAGTLSLQDVRTLLNDGEATTAKTSTTGARFNVKAGAAPSPESETDTSPPEPFVITLARSEDAFEGGDFAVFATHDKGSGIARYEVCEGLLRGCARGESPYAFAGGRAPWLVRVVAFDHDGNKRTAYLFTPAGSSAYGLYAILAILCGIGLYALLRTARRNRQ